MFLVGLYFGRRRIFQNLDAHIAGLGKLMWWGLGVGVVGNLIYATLIPSLARNEPSAPLFVAILGQAIGASMWCLFYVSALILLYRSPQWQRRLDWLAPPGRLALTNYLSQSIICTLIFYGYGLGWFGRVDRVTGIVLAIVIYTVQVLVERVVGQTIPLRTRRVVVALVDVFPTPAVARVKKNSKSVL